MKPHDAVDLIDPNTWKLPAELIGYWQTIIVGLVAIIGTIFLKPLRWWRSRTKGNVKVGGKSAPIRFVSNDLHCHWGGARLNDQSGTAVHGRWHVTNTSGSDVMILKARLGNHASRFTQVSTRHPEDERSIFGAYPVMSYQMSEVSVVWSFFPPISRAPEPLVSDVIFIDNFGHEHRVPSQTFNYLGPTPVEGRE